MHRIAIAACAALLAVPCAAQESPDFRIEGAVFHAAGRPDGGTTAASADHRISLDALGDGVVGIGSSGDAFRVDAGFVAGYPPPTEIEALRFVAADRLEWAPDRAVGLYHLYRDTIAALAGGGAGVCEQPGLTSASAIDPDVPAAGSGYVYLVTAVGRLDEEGTKGNRSDGTPRGGAACP